MKGINGGNHSHNTNIFENSVDANGALTIDCYQKLIQRYSNAEDFVVDLFVKTGSSALACICIPEARRFFGRVSNAEEIAPIDLRIANTLIFRYGRGEIPRGFKISAEIHSMMETYFELHNFDNICGPYYNPENIREWKAGDPIIQNLPDVVLKHLCVLYHTRNFCRGAPKVQSANHFDLHLAQHLIHAPPKTIIDMQMTNAGLYEKQRLRGKNTLSCIDRIQKGTEITKVFGTVIFGTWDENWKSLARFDGGPFEVDKDAFITSIPLLRDGCTITVQGSGYSAVSLVPSKFCILRNYHFVDSKPNAKIQIGTQTSGGPRTLSTLQDCAHVKIIATSELMSDAELRIVNKLEL